MGGWQDWTQKTLPSLAADLLESDLTHVLAPSQSYVLTMEEGYGALVVATSIPDNACVLTCKVVDATGIIPTWSQQVLAVPGGTYTFTPPYSYNGACSPFVTLSVSVNQVHDSQTFIFGQNGTAPGQQGTQLIRPDGRAYPEATELASAAQAGAGSTPLVAAPTSPVRLLLSSLFVSTTGAGCSVQVTVGGGSPFIVSTLGAFNASVQLPPGGLLLDVATPITLTGAAGQTIFASGAFDRVT